MRSLIKIQQHGLINQIVYNVFISKRKSKLTKLAVYKIILKAKKRLNFEKIKNTLY